MTEQPTEFTPEDETPDLDEPITDFGQAVLWGTDWTVETVLNQLQRGNIELNPRFQRRDAWSRPSKSRFIESVILGLPIPQVVLAESREQRGRYIILDGKQRLLSLMQYAGYAEGANNAFGLSGLQVRTDLARKKFQHLENQPDLRPEYDAFLTHTIRTTVIRNWPSLSFLHVVFQRLNTGSLKLSPQELRQALAPGPFTNFVDDFTIEAPAIMRLLGNDRPDPRMRDVELLVRAIALKLRLTEYRGRMKEFLDQTCMILNENWDEREDEVQTAANNFRDGVIALEEIFQEDGIARKLNSRLFNRSIFDALIYFAMDEQIRAQMTENGQAVRDAYQAIIANEAFQDAVESDTAGIPNTGARLNLWGTALNGVIPADIQIPTVQTIEDDRLIIAL